MRLNSVDKIVSITVGVTENEYRRLQVIADARNIKRSAMLRKIIREWMDANYSGKF